MIRVVAIGMLLVAGFIAAPAAADAMGFEAANEWSPLGTAEATHCDVYHETQVGGKTFSACIQLT